MILKRIFGIALGLISSMPIVYATDCELHVAVAAISQGDKVDKQVENQLQMRLTRAAAAAGLAGDAKSSRFFIAGRFDKGFMDVTSGPSQKFLLKTTLTLYIGDADDQKIFSTASFELKGVGASEQRAYLNAMSQLNAQNLTFKRFVEKGKEEIIQYYNKYSAVILTKARTAMKQRDYDEAIYQASQIPECCNGFDEAADLMVEAYGHRMDYEGAQLLSRAQGEWAADPTESGAREAFSFLSQIDPGCSSYPAAKVLGDEIAKTVKEQWVFENVQKYEDALAMEKKKMQNEHIVRTRMIEAARAVGVARAENQPKVVYHYGWF